MRFIRYGLVALVLIILDVRVAGILLHPYWVNDLGPREIRIHATFVDWLALGFLILLHGAVAFSFIRARHSN